MKFLLLAAMIVCGVHFAPAGSLPDGNGKISGTVVDASTNQPVEFATIALADPATGKPVDGSVCDAKGKFTISRIADGRYNVVVSFIGFEAVSIPVSLSPGNDNIDLGTIKLTPKTEILSEVTVEGEKALIEERVDRTIYNAENDATTRGGDATDVLKRVPMLSVDLDGNLSLRGNSNIRVLVNNKPSAIMASSVADALKQIPAEDIKSVEVITSPSAKYDAEGSAGIVNIITKKNVLQGTTLGINTSAGLRGSHLGLNGAYRKGKVGLSLGGWGRGGYNIKGSFANEQTTRDNGTETRNAQQADTRNTYLFGRYTLGMDYDINKNNFITSSVQYGVRNNRSYQDDLTTRTFTDGALTASSLRDVDANNESGTIDINLGYTRLFEKSQKEFSILALYSRDDRTNDFVNNIFNEDTHTISERRKNLNESFNEEITVQADYQTPIGKTQMFETGVKEIVRKVSSDYQYFDAQGADGAYEPSEDTQLTNVFNYEQTIAAGYVSYTLNFLTNYSVKAGTRYEHTVIDAHFQDEVTVDIPDYGIFAPSLNVSRKLKNGNMIKAAYNRRIQRPSIQFLNPNIQASNPLNASLGNPDLDPEYTNNYEMSYSYYVKGISLNFSGYMRNTDNAIQSVREVKGDTILTTYQNIGQEDAYGLSFFANVNVGDKLSLNGGTDIYYSVLDNNVADPDYNAGNEGWVAGYRLFGSYNLSKGWGFQFFGFYRGRQVQLQGTQSGFGIYSLSVKKDFADKKGSVGFGAENFLTSGFKMKNELRSQTISQTSTNELRNMSFKVNFSYRLGKLGDDANAGRRRKRTIRNDDLKDGGSDMGGGGDMPQQPATQPQDGKRGGKSTQGEQQKNNPKAKE